MPNFNKPRFDRGPRQMFQTECAKCGNACEVPFRPNGTRPVYCHNCFQKDSSRPARDQAAPTPRTDQAFNDLKAELRVVNQNLERLIALMTPAAKPKKAGKKKA